MANYKKNLRLVEEHLQEGEGIIASIYGVYEFELMGSDTVRNAILVATDRRIVFFAKKMMGYDLESFPFENISSIEKSKGIMGHSVAFYASGNKVKMKWINQGDIKEFTEYVNSMLGYQHNLTTAQNTDSPVDIPDQIKKLADLKDQGILTEEEYDLKKKELLDKM
jgi:hypothetical protein